MRVCDVMTRDVVVVAPDTTIAEIAALLLRHRVGCTPVVATDGRVIGIVTQTDLEHRVETGTEQRRYWWLNAFTDADAKARAYVKSHGLKAQDVMSRSIVSVSKDASLAELAETLDAHRIRQALVLDTGKLIGIASRADLLRALVQAGPTSSPAAHDNEELHNVIVQNLKRQGWLRSTHVDVLVKDDCVHLAGTIASNDQRRALRILVEHLSAPRRVDDQLKLGRASKQRTGHSH